MSAAAAQTIEHVWHRPEPHYFEGLRNTWVCNQVNCDGEHHHYVPCGPR
jgi:hypothetical protein